MYKQIIRPLLFQLSPETIHHLVVLGLRIFHYIPGGRLLLRACFSMRHPSLEREVFSIRFPNPIGLAAGFDKDAEVYEEIAAMGFGFVEVGTITPLPQPGNPKPRLFRLPADHALINRMGFNNQGVASAVQRFYRRDRLRPNRRSVILGGNLGKNTLTPNEKAPADYLRLFRSLYEYVNYFVINVSCPNIANLACLQNKENLKTLLQGLIEFRRGQNHYRPILLKISPDLSKEQVDEMIEVLIENGLDGIVATNTTTRRDGLQTPADLVAEIGKGGMSGGPLTERSLEMVRYIHEKTEGRFPIIGVGGIMTEDDAIAMLNAGASLIEIYTGFIYNGPCFVKRICKRLKEEAIRKEHEAQQAAKAAEKEQQTQEPSQDSKQAPKEEAEASQVDADSNSQASSAE